MGLILLVFYGLVASIFLSDTKNIIWCLFGLAVIFVFSRIDYGRIIFDGWGVAFAIVMCSMFISETGISSLSLGLSRQTSTEDNQAYGLAAYTSINALLFAVPFVSGVVTRNQIFVVSVLLALSFLIILIAGVRSPLLGFLVGSFFIISRLYTFSEKRNKIIITCCLVVGCVGVAMLSNVIGEIFESLMLALSSFFGGSSYFGDSAALSRVYQRDESMFIFSNNVFLGAGFKYLWIDFPLLQAFSDSGLLIGIVYLYTYLLYPLSKSLLGVFNPNSTVVFFSLLYVCNASRLFLHGQPLDWQHMVYVIPVICFFVFNQLGCESKETNS